MGKLRKIKALFIDLDGVILKEIINNGRSYSSDESFINSVGAVRFTI